jgi:hypothetical protein
MKVTRAGAAGVFVLALAVAGCNQNTAETKAPEEQAPAPVATAEPPAPPPPAAPAPIPPSTETQVNTIDSVMLSRPSDAPSAMIIRVLGTTASSGWTLAKLEPMEGNSDASVMSYQLLATSPEAADDGNTAPEQIITELRVEALSPEVTTIRVVAAMNEVSAPVAQ